MAVQPAYHPSFYNPCLANSPAFPGIYPATLLAAYLPISIKAPLLTPPAYVSALNPPDIIPPAPGIIPRAPEINGLAIPKTFLIPVQALSKNFHVFGCLSLQRFPPLTGILGSI